MRSCSKQGGQAQVAHRQPLAAGLVAQRAGEPGLAAAGGAGDAQVVRLADPVATGQGRHAGLLQSPGMAVVDVLDTGIDPQFGCLSRRARGRRFSRCSTSRSTSNARRSSKLRSWVCGCSRCCSQASSMPVSLRGAQLVGKSVGSAWCSPPSVVVAGAADVCRARGSSSWASSVVPGRQPVQALLEDRGHALVAGRADRQGPLAGLLQALPVIAPSRLSSPRQAR